MTLPKKINWGNMDMPHSISSKSQEQTQSFLDQECCLKKVLQKWSLRRQPDSPQYSFQNPDSNDSCLFQTWCPGVPDLPVPVLNRTNLSLCLSVCQTLSVCLILFISFCLWLCLSLSHTDYIYTYMYIFCIVINYNIYTINFIYT